MRGWYQWWVQHTTDYGTWLGPEWMRLDSAQAWHRELCRGLSYGTVAVLRYWWNGTTWKLDRREGP